MGTNAFVLVFLLIFDYRPYVVFLSSILQVPFLNLMANLQQRSGRVQVRVGGNTQDTAVLVPSTPDGKILEKDLAGVTNPVSYPSIPQNKLIVSFAILD